MVPRRDPQEISDSLDAYLARHSRRSHVLYLVVLVSALAALAALPLIRVEVGTVSRGAIRPRADQYEVRTGAAGRVAAVRLEKNQSVEPGDTLLVLEHGRMDQQLAVLERNVQEAEAVVADLDQLIRLLRDPHLAGQRPSPTFRTEQLTSQHRKYQEEMGERLLEIRRAVATWERARQLAKQEFIASTELEATEFELTRLRSDSSLLQRRYAAEWTDALQRARQRLEGLEIERREKRELRRAHVLIAPVAGTITELVRLYPGSSVGAGEVVARISPDAPLVAEVLVSPRDIGYLREGQRANVQIDAFDYTIWGGLSGTIESLPDDALLVNGTPVFPVRVRLDRTSLKGSNGIRGSLRKGMTLQARFLLAERSLLQLLYEDIHDWFAS